VSANKSPDDDSAQLPSGNADYQWAQFDSEAYFQHYYGQPHPDDDRVIKCAVAAMKGVAPVDAKFDVIDVGTGPNLIPLFCALPRSRSLTVWEYAQSNIAWLEEEMLCEEMRPQWQHFWRVTREAYLPDYRLPDDPMPIIRASCTVKQGSIFDLPERTWDIATMFFCAESITGRQDEFEAACSAYARCVKPGGTLLAAFLVRSAGYVVADHPFPSLNLSAESIEAVFERHARTLATEKIGIVEREIRSGYAGFVFLNGVAR
jgi:NNMT/PNMT/TEMT family